MKLFANMMTLLHDYNKVPFLSQIMLEGALLCTQNKIC